MRRTFAAVLLAVGLAVAAGCGSGGDATTPAEGEVIIEEHQPATPSPYRGGHVENPTTAPELGLRNQDGKRVTVASLRGNVVFVSFLYTSCPDICPLITEKLRRAQAKAGGKNIRIIAVSVDPKGDTPKAAKSFLAQRNMTGKMDWLLGSAPELRATWKRWGILAEESKEDPHLIEHSGVVWVLDQQGRRVVYYPLSTIDPDDIAHDAGLLLKK